MGKGVPGVIGVSTLMLPGGPAPFSPSVAEANNSVLIAGPADTMLASSTGWELDDFGTAGALVAATTALIKERYPHLSPALVGRALAMSARDHPKGGYAPSVGFGVLDPYDAILDAGKLAAVTTTAQSGPGVVAVGAHFGGGPPGVISALAPVGPVAEVYWTLMGLGVLLLVAAVVLAVRRPHRVPRAARPHRARRAGRARHRHGRHPPPGPDCALVLTAATLPASRIASYGSSTPNPTDGAYPPFRWSRADIASARPTSAGDRCGYRSLISATVAATSAPAVPKSSSCHPVEEASIVSAGPAMRTELLASVRDGENGTGPPGSITAETPMIPGSPEGY